MTHRIRVLSADLVTRVIRVNTRLPPIAGHTATRASRADKSHRDRMRRTAPPGQQRILSVLHVGAIALGQAGTRWERLVHRHRCRHRWDPGVLTRAHPAGWERLGPRGNRWDPLAFRSEGLIPLLRKASRRIRKPLLYPLSYEGGPHQGRARRTATVESTHARAPSQRWVIVPAQ